MTALHIAATHGHADVVRILIDGGARLDLHDNDQMTALHFACTEGVVEIVQYVLRKWEELVDDMTAVK